MHLSAGAVPQAATLEWWLEPRLQGGDAAFGPEELLRLTCELGLARDVWSGLVHHDPARPRAICLHAQRELELWLVCWLDGQSTGILPDDGTTGCVFVADGCLLEDVFQRQSVSPEHARTYRRPANTAFCFTAGRAHAIRHDGHGCAVSVHASMPSHPRIARVMRPELPDRFGHVARPSSFDVSRA